MAAKLILVLLETSRYAHPLEHFPPIWLHNHPDLVGSALLRVENGLLTLVSLAVSEISESLNASG